MERPKGPWNPLERPKGSWNRASGSIWNSPKGSWNAPWGTWNRASGSIWNALLAPWNGPPLQGSQRGLGTPLDSWNALGLLEQSLRLYLERALAQLERPRALGTEPQAPWNGPPLQGSQRGPSPPLGLLIPMMQLRPKEIRHELPYPFCRFFY